MCCANILENTCRSSLSESPTKSKCARVAHRRRLPSNARRQSRRNARETGEPPHIASKSHEKVLEELSLCGQEESDSLTERAREANVNHPKPYIVEFEDVPDGPFHRFREVGKTVAIIINRAHSFFELVYQPLAGTMRGQNLGLELLLISLVNAHERLRNSLSATDEAHFSEFYAQWSHVLGAYLDRTRR